MEIEYTAWSISKDGVLRSSHGKLTEEDLVDAVRRKHEEWMENCTVKQEFAGADFDKVTM